MRLKYIIKGSLTSPGFLYVEPSQLHHSFSTSPIFWSQFKFNVEGNPGFLWFCFILLGDWSSKLGPFLNQSDTKLKPIASWSVAFSRAWISLRVFTLSFHCLLLIFSFHLIGLCDYFGFHSTPHDRKHWFKWCVVLPHLGVGGLGDAKLCRSTREKNIQTKTIKKRNFLVKKESKR